MLRLGEEVEAVERLPGGAVTHLRSGKQLPSEVVLFTAGRQQLPVGGLPVDDLVEAVFNVLTLADAYKVAALDAANRLGELAGRHRACAA